MAVQSPRYIVPTGKRRKYKAYYFQREAILNSKFRLFVPSSDPHSGLSICAYAGRFLTEFNGVSERKGSCQVPRGPRPERWAWDLAVTFPGSMGRTVKILPAPAVACL